MYILGIETSCDETAAAVVRRDGLVKSNIISSQAELFADWGGVVPEVAARAHVERMLPVVDAALQQAHVGWDHIEQISVTARPGLIGSLLIGQMAAQALSWVYDKPLIQADHLKAHILANWLRLDDAPAPDIRFPAVGLLVSGGHTELILLKDAESDWKIIGQTRDDAVGEAFDKVGALLGLGYPGGPAVSRLGQAGDPAAFDLPRAWLEEGSYDFSFSGLKTAVRRLVQQQGEGPESDKTRFGADLAASFEAAAVDVLVKKTQQAAVAFNAESILLAGGVAANARLRTLMKSAFGDKLFVPHLSFCTDNAAMVGMAPKIITS